MIFGLVLAVAGIGILATLMFNAAVYALPVVIGIWILQQALHHGFGSVAAIIAALIAGAFTYAVGHIVFETSRSFTLRVTVAILFVVPAAVVGYNLSYALLANGLHTPFWLVVFSVVGAAIVGATTFARLALRHDTECRSP